MPDWCASSAVIFPKTTRYLLNSIDMRHCRLELSPSACAPQIQPAARYAQNARLSASNFWYSTCHVGDSKGCKPQTNAKCVFRKTNYQQQLQTQCELTRESYYATNTHRGPYRHVVRPRTARTKQSQLGERQKAEARHQRPSVYFGADRSLAERSTR